MTELRVVIDTNVAVSAVLLPASKPRKAFDLAVRHGQLLISEPTIAELEEVLRRPKFDKYISERQRLEFLFALVEQAEMVSVVQSVAVCRDQSDDKFLEVAVNGNASHLLSGDPDLSELNPFRGVLILSPSVFLDQFSSQPPS